MNTSRSSRLSLDDKYELEDGTVFMTGIQALVRLAIEQARLDRRQGHRNGILISGYPGSPVAGLDLELARAKRHLDPLDICVIPGVNEELAAASVRGSQLLGLFGSSKVEAVTGLWYGKSPGLDRAMDVMRHANYASIPSMSGVLAVVGDDPAAKSSFIPNASEWDFLSLAMPVLYPASISEFVELGLHGIALSRWSGLWVGLKVVSDLCDGGASVALRAPSIRLPDHPAAVLLSSSRAFAPFSPDAERTLFDERLPAAMAYARANDINSITARGAQDRVGLVAAGKTYSDLLQALDDMGLGLPDLPRLGVRLLKIGMLFPLDPGVVREFAAGLREIVVLEEKRDLIEMQVRAILYGSTGAPLIMGKKDEQGHALVPSYNELDADRLVELVGPRLLRLGDVPGVTRRLAEVGEIRRRSDRSDFLVRTANYCSGCPYNLAMIRVDGELMGGGTGCHGFALSMPQERRSAVATSPMGTEGAPWIGAAPFVDADHFVQNIGDGTFFHSGSLALRAVVSAGANITFRLLYNQHISMTGGQEVPGAQPIVSLTHSLRAEGVKRTIIISEDRSAYRGERLAPNAQVHNRDQHEWAMRELRRVPGVTVLIYDQECAAEKRRARKRGRQRQPVKHVFINEAACEGCGDCGNVSNCMSVQPVETEFGRKTQIHQSSCNADYACIKGDCPAFLTVYSTEGPFNAMRGPLEPPLISDPVSTTVTGTYRIYMPGTGGTGVVTANRILAHAAMIDGRSVQLLDQLGAAQKGGAVLSSLVINDGPPMPFRSNRVGLGLADLVLGFDALGVVSRGNIGRLSATKTVVVADSSIQPTADMIRDVSVPAPDQDALKAEIDRYSRADRNIWLDAGAAVLDVLGDHLLTNIFLIGVAYEAGLIPIASQSIEAAIRLNGVDTEQNVAAFRFGRFRQHDPAAFEAARSKPPRSFQAQRDRYRKILKGQAGAYDRLLDRCSHLSEETRSLLAVRLGELIQYQDATYAQRYLTSILAVSEREHVVAPESDHLTQAASRNLYKLMAYKDEYEVARLLLDAEITESVLATFAHPKIKFNLRPPLIGGHGLKNKVELGPWFKVVLRLLIPMRRLRGTRLDPFGRTPVRRLERELIEWYLGLLKELTNLRASNYDTALAILSSPDAICGYESLKVRNAEAVKAEVDLKVHELRSPVAA